MYSVCEVLKVGENSLKSNLIELLKLDDNTINVIVEKYSWDFIFTAIR